jgi:hypothetical protein
MYTVVYLFYDKKVSFPFGCYYGGGHIPNNQNRIINCVSCYCRANGVLRCCPWVLYYLKTYTFCSSYNLVCNLGKFIHLACKARNNLVWLTCVFIIIVLNFLTYLCYFLICHIYTLYAIQSCYYNMPHCILMNCYVQS